MLIRNLEPVPDRTAPDARTAPAGAARQHVVDDDLNLDGTSIDAADDMTAE
jgi:hypothetical protein